MPVSLETYRIRIGQFSSEKYSIKCKVPACRKSSLRMKSKLTSTTIRIMSILSLILTISAHLQSFAIPTSSSVNCSLEHSNIHPTSSHLIIPVNSALEIKDDIHPIQCITEDRNFLARYKYGNRRNKKNGMTIMHWNKGPSLLQNKMHDIENIIDK